jgi:hypothetical protein
MSLFQGYFHTSIWIKRFYHKWCSKQTK